MKQVIHSEMASYAITTNNHRREVIDAYDLTPKERKDFDYLDWEGIEGGTEGASFVRYKGQLYDLGDILQAPEVLAKAGWEGFNSDSFFSGLAFHWGNDDSGEYVVVGRVIVEG